MPTKDADQLVILGNGFDLNCGLKTSFRDYFAFKKKEILRKLVGVKKNADGKKLDDLKDEELEHLYNEITSLNKLRYHLHCVNDQIISSDFIESNVNSEINEQFNKIKKLDFSFLSFWDVYFISLEKQKENWADVESNIANYLKINVEEILSYIEDLDGQDEYYFDIEADVKQNDILVFFMLLTIDIDKIKKFDLDNFLIYLKEQLVIFEKNLNDYILSLFVDENPNNIYSYDGPFIEQIKFIDNFKKTISKLVEDNSSIEKYYILSFNYTFFPSKRLEGVNALRELYSVDYKEDLPNCIFYENIHGKLGKQNSNIIIGIDEKDIDEQQALYKFTKTYQLLEFGDENLDGNLGLHSNVKKIKFFGHSLAEADYSYFQSIFDFYDIYNTDVQLIFYYVNYENSNGEEVDGKEELFLRVIKLMKEYGKTLDNKDHGMNLLHKLKLENRIVLKDLNTD